MSAQKIGLAVWLCSLAIIAFEPTLQAANLQTPPRPPIQVPVVNPDTSPLADKYYAIHEPSSGADKTPTPKSVIEPQELVRQLAKVVARKSLSLVRWALYNEYLPRSADLYSRKLHFGRWINDPTDDSCMNTRAKVMARDSQEPVTFRTDKNCVVESGLWKDPYTGFDLRHRTEVQIDHMVPLKHAYDMGAWKWDFRTRCLYANFLGYNPHLVATSVHENTSKGDRSPVKYLPPDHGYRCTYIKHWLTVKLIWRLAMTEEETMAMRDSLTDENCSPAEFNVTYEELNRTRNYIRENINYCIQNQR